MKLILAILSSLFCLNINCAENARSKKEQKLVCLNRQLRHEIKQKQLLHETKALCDPAKDSEIFNQIKDDIKESIKHMKKLESKISELKNADT